MSLFFGVTQILYLFPSFIQSNLGLPPPQGMGGEHEHHGKGSCPWAQSHDGGVLFVGGTGFRYRAVSTWSESKSSQLSHGKRQTRKFDKSVMLWRFPLKMDNQHAFSRWTGLYYFVPNVDIGCDPWLLPGRRIIDIRWDPLDHSPLLIWNPLELVLLQISSLALCSAPATPMGPMASPEPSALTSSAQ